MRPVVAIVDYGSGNLRSAEKALARVAGERTTGQDVIVTSDAGVVAAADRIVLPGVGAYADCMNGLSSLPGMVAALNDAVIARGVPFLGICVGMQLMASLGREFGDHAGLGWIKGEVVKMTPSDPVLKIPQIGWNELSVARAHPVLEGLPPGAHAYFVHSFAMRTAREEDVLARTDYGGPVTAVIGRDNLVGVQFHPEKSQAVGLTLLGNFLGLAAVTAEPDFVSIEGPVEMVDGKLVLRIPLPAGGDKLEKSAGNIGRIEGDVLRVDIPAWLAQKVGLEDGAIVIVDNQGGTFNIELSDESDD